MIRELAWLVAQVGENLPPAVVGAAMKELGLENVFDTATLREDQQPSVGSLREITVRLGLISEAHGWLRVTAKGRALADDPVRLWWYAAGRLELGTPGSFEETACVATLLWLAAGRPVGAPEWEAFGVGVGSASGWRHGDGSAVTRIDLRSGCLELLQVIGHLVAVDGWPWGGATPTPGGVLLVRAALAAGG